MFKKKKSLFDKKIYVRLFPEKVWNECDFNLFITKILQFFNPEKVWTTLSTACQKW